MLEDHYILAYSMTYSVAEIIDILNKPSLSDSPASSRGAKGYHQSIDFFTSS